MIEELLAPQLAPFTVALVILLFIALMEGVGLLFGIAFSAIVDSLLPDFDLPDADLDIGDVDADLSVNVHGPDMDAAATPTAGAFTRILGWLCVGRVPVLILLIAFLTVFCISGFMVQNFVKGLTGLFLPATLAVIPALFVAIPGTRYLGLGLSKIMPKEETEAVSSDGFIGKVAVVTLGIAQRGLPAQAKLKDHFGQTHYIFVEPDIDHETFEAGVETLVVRKVGSTFRVIANTNAAMSSSSAETQ